MSAREGIANGLAFIPDIHSNITNAFSILKSATDEPGLRSEMAYTLMQALEKLPSDEPGNGGSEIRGMVETLASRRGTQ